MTEDKIEVFDDYTLLHVEGEQIKYQHSMAGEAIQFVGIKTGLTYRYEEKETETDVVGSRCILCRKMGPCVTNRKFLLCCRACYDKSPEDRKEPPVLIKK